MRAIREGIDDRLLGGARELNQVRVAAHSGDDQVHVAVENSGRIGD